MQIALNEADVVQIIKSKEAATGRIGQFFITKTNGIMKKVKLTVQNDFLIADGKVVLDMHHVQILPLH